MHPYPPELLYWRCGNHWHVGSSPGTGEFTAKMASYAENVSIWWRHHVMTGRFTTMNQCYLKHSGKWEQSCLWVNMIETQSTCYGLTRLTMDPSKTRSTYTRVGPELIRAVSSVMAWIAGTLIQIWKQNLKFLTWNLCYGEISLTKAKISFTMVNSILGNRFDIKFFWYQPRDRNRSYST